MNDQIAYLCSMIKEAQFTEEYKAYIEQINELETNVRYNEVIDFLVNNDRTCKGYQEYKQEQLVFEKELRKYQKEINDYFQFVVDTHKNLIKGDGLSS